MRQKRSRARRSIVLGVILAIVCVAILVVGYLAYTALYRPQVLFEQTDQETAEPTAQVTPAFDIQAYLTVEATPEEGTETVPPELLATATPVAIQPEETPVATEPEETPVATEPEEAPVATQPEQTSAPTDEPKDQLSGIVNVALFGIDAGENGRTTSGTMPHTDVNMVLAINFDTKDVSLISLARDVLTTVPGYSGFYKFNGVFNVGGGMDDPQAGFELSCRALEEWFGGVSISHYYGLDFQAVIDLVDAIGGIDFDVDITLYDRNRNVLSTNGHLDGERALAYLRMRKTAGGLDYQRTARQREMLVAIFQKLKNEGKLSIIPELLKTMGDNLYTNTTLEQTAALANFARSIDPNSIRTYSIYGDMSEQYLWRYCMIDQQKRLDILKEVYGIDATPMAVDTQRYERFLYESGFMAIQHLNIAKKLFEEVNGTFPAEAMSEDQKKAYADCWIKFSDLNTAFEEVNQWMLTFWDDAIEFTPEEKEQKGTYYQTLTTLEYQLKLSAEAMKTAFDLKTESNWSLNIEDWFGKDSVINEVYVDFR